ncbi:hypothetical protein K469DRAFT_574333, partial [Zopfia rhizophila CBS 207.26]
LKKRLTKVNYTNNNTLKNYLLFNINAAYKKLFKYYVKFKNALVYYITIILYSTYKYYLKAL